MKKQESKKSYAIFGLGEFGRSVAEELMAAGADVMAIDKDEDLVSDIAPHVTMAVQVDATELHAFDTLGLSNMDGVIVTITSCLEASIMAIMAAKEAGVPFILAKSRNVVVRHYGTVVCGCRSPETPSASFSAAVKPDAVTLHQAGLVQQLFCPAVMIELGVGFFPAELYLGHDVEPSFSAFLREYLYNAVGGIRAVEGCRRTSTDILHLFDVLHRDV